MQKWLDIQFSFYFHVKEAFYKPSLSSQFSFKLKPGQKQAINCLLERKDVFAVISTGLNKSFICQLFSMAIEQKISEGNQEISLTVWCSYFPVDQPYSGRSLGLNCTSLLNPDDLSRQSPLPQLLFAAVEKVLEIRLKMVLKDSSSYSQGSRTSWINGRRWITHCWSLDRQKVCSTLTFYDAYD